MLDLEQPEGSAVHPEAARSSEVRLSLDDGTQTQGCGFGAVKPVRGEVVFDTAMTGYVEALTGPSYCGQILVLTYPLVGNYGVPPRPGSLDGLYESARIQVQALVIQHYVGAYSHHAASRSLHEWLSAEGVRGAPWHADLTALARRANGIMIGNGPGDPKDLAPLVARVRSLLASYRKPMFGVCLGNQILALAAGADTYELPYGHRGVNQPLQDLAHSPLLHHRPEPRLRREGRLAAQRLGAVVRKRQRRQQRRDPFAAPSQIQHSIPSRSKPGPRPVSVASYWGFKFLTAFIDTHRRLICVCLASGSES